MEIHFAPLQGHTEYAFRSIHNRIAGGIDCYYTPFLRLEKGSARNKDVRDIRQENNVGVPVVPQLIAADADEFNRLSDLIQQNGWTRADLNLGCSFPMQTKLGRGAGVLSHPDRVEALMNEIAKRPDMSYSVKMRLGMEQSTEWQDLIQILNESRLCQITMHPRTGRQDFKGVADIEDFAKFHAQCTKPLIYNGDLTELEQIRVVAERFPDLKGIMIGRGLLARPTLAKEYRLIEQGSTDVPYSDAQVLKTIKEMHSAWYEHCQNTYQGDHQVLPHLKDFWYYMDTLLPKKVYKAIMKSTSINTYRAAVAAV